MNINFFFFFFCREINPAEFFFVFARKHGKRSTRPWFLMLVSQFSK